MAGVSRGGQDMLAKWEDLRAESARLRLEFLHIELGLSHTLASFAGIRRSEDLQQRSRDAAWKGYHTIIRMMRKDLPADVQKDLEARAERLRAALAGEKPHEKDDFEFVGTRPQPAAASPELTRRELEVLACIAKGQSTKQAAATLGITFKTAACHRYHLMTKLDVHDTASLVRYAIRNGLVRP